MFTIAAIVSSVPYTLKNKTPREDGKSLPHWAMHHHLIPHMNTGKETYQNMQQKLVQNHYCH